jgi:hypothetical protein
VLQEKLDGCLKQFGDVPGLTRYPPENFSIRREISVEARAKNRQIRIELIKPQKESSLFRGTFVYFPGKLG